MKKLVFTLIILLNLSCLGVFAQITFTMKPNDCRGKDARIIAIAGLSTPGNTNYGSYGYLDAATWTFSDIGGGLGYIHSFIDFADLHSIPQGATITSASLTLYGVPSYASAPLGNYGANDAWLERVTSTWDENTITWNSSHPSTTTTNHAGISAVSAWNQNRVVDVKNLVQDMVNLPASQRYGFGMKLQDESTFRWIVFASSDNPDTSLHPKLEVTFTSCSVNYGRIASTIPFEDKYPGDMLNESQIDQVNNNTIPLIISPNPVKDIINIEYSLLTNGKTVISLISQNTGSIIKTLEVDGTSGQHLIQLPIDKSIPKGGSLLLKITQDKSESTKRILIPE